MVHRKKVFVIHVETLDEEQTLDSWEPKMRSWYKYKDRGWYGWIKRIC